LQRERSLTSGDAFRFAALATVLIVVVSGAVESLVERGDFDSTFVGIWFKLVSVSDSWD
jgi:hypothetical protein